MPFSNGIKSNFCAAYAEPPAESAADAAGSRRNATASRSHRKKCFADLAVLGIDPAKIKSVTLKKQL